jgi:hypothetical protein
MEVFLDSAGLGLHNINFWGWNRERRSQPQPTPHCR